MIAPLPVHYERRTHPDAGDPQPPKLREKSNPVKPTRRERAVPLGPLDCIGIYQDPMQMMLPLNDANDDRDASLYGVGRMFTSPVNAKPLSQFDRQVFNAKEAGGRYGITDIKMAMRK
jgi:hypothetical protein